MKAFTQSLHTFKQSDKTKIAIYRPEKSTNDALYESVVSVFRPTACVEVVNTFFLYSYDAMFCKRFDILMVLESELLITQDCVRIREYLRRGGALIIGGSNMLMQEIVTKRDAQASYFGVKKDDEEDALTLYKKTLAHIGIKPYVSDVVPSKVSFDTDFLEGVADTWKDMVIPPDSAKMNTTSNRRAPQPYAGTCFPERYEVLRNFEVVSGYDALGRKLNTAVNFAQNYETGARVCLIASNAENSFLDAKNPYFASILQSSVKFCLNEIMVSFFESSYACYKYGENPQITYTIKSFASVEKTVDAQVRIMGAGNTVITQTFRHVIAPGEEIAGSMFWENAEFTEDFYETDIRLYENGSIISKADNAFVIWNEEVLAQGSEMFCDGEYFLKNGKRGALLGTNYYDSNSGSAMWVYPNISHLNADLKDMADFGIEWVRVHYHHPKWFCDFFRQLGAEVPERYRGLDASYLPGEKHLRIFDAHVYLCQKYHMIMNYDLFTLIPEELGDPRGWGGPIDYICLEEKIEKQKEFLSLIVNRYKGIPGIAWDIHNEPHYTGLTPETYHRFVEPVSLWIKMMRDYIAGLGEKHPITSGGFMNFLDEDADAPHDIVDYLTIHAFWRYADQTKSNIFVGPQVYHEAWMNRPYTPEGCLEQLADMRYALINSLRVGFAGFMPWQWTEQVAMWQAEGTYYGENWDDLLGCCVHNNGTLKPAGRFFRDFIRVFNDLEIDSYLGDNKIRTKNGLITFGVPQEMHAGEYYMLYTENDVPVRGIAWGNIVEKDFTISTNSESANVFFDFSRDNSVYCKADEACHFTASFSKDITKAVFTNGKEEVEIPVNGKVLELDLTDWQTYYWIRLSF